jgi:hypothetical protein
VIPSQKILDDLAGRLERAYGLRGPNWRHGCSTGRVWFAAALRLWETHYQDRVPLDPELYVASQPIGEDFADPWTELAEPAAGRRYGCRVRRIVAQLGAELRREVRRAERRIRRGRGIEAVLSAHNSGLSPLGCFIVAQRAGRVDLADCFVAAAALQNRSCPLYQSASLALLPADLYPVESLALVRELAPQPRAERSVLSLN